MTTDEKQAFSFTEEDLRENEQSDESNNGLTGLKSIDREAQPLTRLHESVEKIREKPVDLHPDGKLTLKVPAYTQKLPKETYKQIDMFLLVVSQHPEANILIESYTDSSGSARRNRQLSQLRADRVKEYFIAQGIDPARIKAIGLGDKYPITSNATLAGRDINRRIEIELVHE